MYHYPQFDYSYRRPSLSDSGHPSSEWDLLSRLDRLARPTSQDGPQSRHAGHIRPASPTFSLPPSSKRAHLEGEPRSSQYGSWAPSASAPTLLASPWDRHSRSSYSTHAFIGGLPYPHPPGCCPPTGSGGTSDAGGDDGSSPAETGCETEGDGSETSELESLLHRINGPVTRPSSQASLPANIPRSDTVIAPGSHALHLFVLVAGIWVTQAWVVEVGRASVDVALATGKLGVLVLGLACMWEVFQDRIRVISDTHAQSLDRHSSLSTSDASVYF